MTKEEAIERLNRCREILEITSHMDNQNRKAFDIAIKALEKEPCEDAISRQAAIDALRDAENHAFNSYYKGLVKAHKIIAGLPPI